MSAIPPRAFAFVSSGIRVRRLPSPAMHQSLVALLLDPLDEAPDVAIRSPNHSARFLLRELLLHHVADHVDPLQLFDDHRHSSSPTILPSC
jgi:hypothetical protein